MIEVTDYQGNTISVAKSAIATVHKTEAASQWHGIRALIKLFDGKVLEVRDSYERIMELLTQ